MPVIATNTAANSALRYLNINSSEVSGITSKLASGSRITKASDDAAGLAIGTRVQSDVTVLSQAATNATQATSILQTADGGLSNINDILQRMKSLATQSDSGSVTDSERTYIDAEFQQLLDEVDGIATGTRYNGVSLLDGTSQFSSATSDGISSGSYITDTQATDLTTNLGITAGDTVTITTSDGAATPTTNSVVFTMVDYDGDGDMDLQDVADSINAGDTATPKSANVAASLETDAEGRQRLVLTAANTGDAISAVADTTGTSAAGLGLIDSTGALISSGDVGVDFMVGTSTTDVINLSIDSVSSSALGISASSVGTQTDAQTAITALDKAIGLASQARAEVGATMSRFEFRSQTIATSSENLQAAASAIMDADVAAEKSNLSSADVKAQAAIAALTQANQMPQELLSLLKS